MIGKKEKKNNMNVIDKFLKQYSYKFDKGYPDIGNPKDKEMLFEFAYKLTEKKTILKEGSEVYDKTILRALGTDSIPQSNINGMVKEDLHLISKLNRMIWILGKNFLE